MWSFIVEHYRLMLIGLWILIEVFFGVFLLCRKSKSNEPLHAVFSLLPGMILRAEKKFGAGHGAEKKQFVLDLAQRLFYSFTGVAYKENSHVWKLVAAQVEEILKTPSKKEDK